MLQNGSHDTVNNKGCFGDDGLVWVKMVNSDMKALSTNGKIRLYQTNKFVKICAWGSDGTKLCRTVSVKEIRVLKKS